MSHRSNSRVARFKPVDTSRGCLLKLSWDSLTLMPVVSDFGRVICPTAAKCWHWQAAGPALDLSQRARGALTSASAYRSLLCPSPGRGYNPRRGARWQNPGPGPPSQVLADSPGVDSDSRSWGSSPVCRCLTGSGGSECRGGLGHRHGPATPPVGPP